LGQLCIGALIVAAFLVLRPFLAATVWAMMIVIVTWTTMRRIQAWLWGRRWLAIAAMLVILVLLFALPLTLGVATVIANHQEIVDPGSLSTCLQDARAAGLADCLAARRLDARRCVV
jgi:predicted PurR-regulated permease PerM